MTPREALIEAVAKIRLETVFGEPYEMGMDRAAITLDVLLARRDLLLEALGGVEDDSADAGGTWWRFPVSEEAQK